MGQITYKRESKELIKKTFTKVILPNWNHFSKICTQNISRKFSMNLLDSYRKDFIEIELKFRAYIDHSGLFMVLNLF